MNLEAQLTAINTWFTNHPLVSLLLLVWTLAWKGVALWNAAERQQKYWFALILIANTFGILEILYLLLVAKKYKVEVVEA